MKDRYGREIDYLRVSVTQRCNLNCRYCGKAPPDAAELPAEDLLTLIRAFSEVGVTKLRFTGGEPLVRKDLCALISRAAAIPGITRIGITTNGLLLREYVYRLRESGVTLLNVSLDALDPQCYAALTGRDVLPAVLDGLEAALSAGFERVKLNAVLIRGVNDGEAERLISLAREFPLDVRFIELMPFGAHSAEQIVSSDELLRRFPTLQPLRENEGTASYYAAPGFRGRIGFISPISKKFCADCSRVRLLADGSVKPCLGRPENYPLAPYLRDPERLRQEIRTIVYDKPAGHGFYENDASSRAMNRIGG